MEVEKLSEAVKITNNLAQTILLPVSLIGTEGVKLHTVTSNLDTIYKAALVLENQIDTLKNEITDLRKSIDQQLDTDGEHD